MHASQWNPLAHWPLLKTLVARDLAQRYQGTLLGASWSLLYPFLMLGMYVFVFQGMFSARWPAPPLQSTSTLAVPESLQFAFNLYAGLLVVSCFTEVIGRAPRLISDQPQLVRRVVFPLPLLAVVLSISAWLQSVVQWLILVLVLLVSMLASAAISNADPQPMLRWLLVSVPLSLMLLALVLPYLCAVAWVLAATGTYLRDLAQLSPALSAALMFLGPVFYPLASVPEWIQWAFFLNPASAVIESLRAVLLQAQWPPWPTLLGYALGSVAAAGFGHWLFVRVQSGFADVV